MPVKDCSQTNNEDQRAIFYTAMYHAFLSPNLFTDVDGRYLGMDLKVHTTDMKHPVYTISLCGILSVRYIRY